MGSIRCDLRLWRDCWIVFSLVQIMVTARFRRWRKRYLKAVVDTSMEYLLSCSKRNIYPLPRKDVIWWCASVFTSGVRTSEIYIHRIPVAADESRHGEKHYSRKRFSHWSMRFVLNWGTPRFVARRKDFRNASFCPCCSTWFGRMGCGNSMNVERYGKHFVYTSTAVDERYHNIIESNWVEPRKRGWTECVEKSLLHVWNTFDLQRARTQGLNMNSLFLCISVIFF